MLFSRYVLISTCVMVAHAGILTFLQTDVTLAEVFSHGLLVILLLSEKSQAEMRIFYKPLPVISSKLSSHKVLLCSFNSKDIFIIKE